MKLAILFIFYFLISNKKSLKLEGASKYTTSIQEKHLIRKRKRKKKVMKTRNIRTIKATINGKRVLKKKAFNSTTVLSLSSEL
jgi:hypothetical protein